MGTLKYDKEQLEQELKDLQDESRKELQAADKKLQTLQEELE